MINGARNRKPLGSRFSFIFRSSALNRTSFRGTRDTLRGRTIAHTLSGTKGAPSRISFSLTNSLLGRYVNSSFNLQSLGVPFVKLCKTYSAVTLSLKLTSVLISYNTTEIAITSASDRFYSTRHRFELPLRCNKRHAPASRHATATTKTDMIREERDNGPTISTIAVNEVASLNVGSTGGVKTTVTPTTTGAVTSFLGSASSSPSSFSVVLANSLNGIKSELLYRLLRGSHKVSVRDIRTSYKLLLCSTRGRSIRTNNSNYNYNTSVLGSCVVQQLRDNRLSHILFITANTLVSPASSLRNRDVPSVTRTILLSGPV